MKLCNTANLWKMKLWSNEKILNFCNCCGFLSSYTSCAETAKHCDFHSISETDVSAYIYVNKQFVTLRVYINGEPLSQGCPKFLSSGPKH